MKITVGIVNSKISDYTREEYDLLRDALSFFKDGHFFAKSFRDGIWDGKVYLFSGRSFPTGLLHLVLEVIPNVILRKPRYPKPIKADPKILKTKHMLGKYSYQLRGVQAVLDHRRGILDFATNSGKSNIASASIVYINQPTLFLVDRKELMEQMYDTLCEQTDLEIGKWGSGVNDKKFVTVGMVQTISRKLKDKTVKSWLSNIKCVFNDETQNASSKSVLGILEACTNASYRIGLSGTPLDKSNLDNAKIKSQLGAVIAKISNEDLVKSGVSARPIVSMVKIPQIEAIKVFEELSLENSMKNADEKREVIYPKVYEAGIIENYQRNLIGVNLTKKLLKSGEIILILVKRIKHGENLKLMLNKKGIEVAFCHGSSSEEERETEISNVRDGKSKVLILSKIGNVGLNISNLTCGLYMGGGKSANEVIQAIGRYLRLSVGGVEEVLFYDFYDCDEGGYLEQHSEIRKGFYEREKFEIKTVEPKRLDYSLRR